MTASTAPDGAAWNEAAISQSWNQVVSDYKVCEEAPPPPLAESAATGTRSWLTIVWSQAFHGVRARGGTVDDLPEEYLREPADGSNG